MSLHGRGGRKILSASDDGGLQGTMTLRPNRTGAHGNSRRLWQYTQDHGTKSDGSHSIKKGKWT